MNKQEFLEKVNAGLFNYRDIDEGYCTIVVADDDGVEWCYRYVVYFWDDFSVTHEDLCRRGDPERIGESKTEFIMPTRIAVAVESIRVSLIEWDQRLQEAGVTEGEEYDRFCKALEGFGRMVLFALERK